MNVVIDGVEYVPKIDIPELNEKRSLDCLETLTEMRYFNQNHKMKALSWNAINALSPDLAKLSEEEAFDAVRTLQKNKD